MAICLWKTGTLECISTNGYIHWTCKCCYYVVCFTFAIELIQWTERFNVIELLGGDYSVNYLDRMEMNTIRVSACHLKIGVLD